MTMPATLSRKLHKVLETKTDSPDLLVALQTLSSFYGENTPAARTNLRGEIEKKGLEINHNFLSSFKEVQKQLDELQKDVDEMRSSCDEMSERLQKTKVVSGKLVESADKLREERKKNETCTKIITEFLHKFQLGEEEQQALQSGKVDEAFFKSLQRMHQIQADCRLLLRTQHHQAGLEIMDSISIQQESAYRRLYRWVREETRTLENDAAEPEYDRMVHIALKALRERPVYLSNCLGDIGNYRCKAIVKGFINALTIGGPNGMPRPIEVHAHDPIRYVGDMLAWVHQALASEHELLNNLIGPEADVEYIAPSSNMPPPSPFQNPHNQPNNSSNNYNNTLSSSNPLRHNAGIQRSMSITTLLNTGNAAPTGVSNLVTVLNITFDGICKPFKVRVEQVLFTKPGIVVVFRLANLLDFYARTITNLMTPKSSLPLLFNECKHDCLKVFYDELQDHAEKMKQNPPVPPLDLSPPAAIRDTLAKLKELISTFNASLVPAAERAAEFTPILQKIVDPLLQSCVLSATVKQLDLSSMAVYMINCISSLMVILVQHDFTISRIEMLNAQIEAHMHTIVEEQTARMLQNCGLAQKLSVAQYRESTTKPLSQELGMEKPAIFETIRAFEATIIELGVLVLPHCDKLINPKIRSLARKNIATLIAGAYGDFYRAISDPAALYDQPLSMFKHTPDQVKTILDA